MFCWIASQVARYHYNIMFCRFSCNYVAFLSFTSKGDCSFNELNLLFLDMTQTPLICSWNSLPHGNWTFQNPKPPYICRSTFIEYLPTIIFPSFPFRPCTNLKVLKSIKRYVYSTENIPSLISPTTSKSTLPISGVCEKLHPKVCQRRFIPTLFGRFCFDHDLKIHVSNVTTHCSLSPTINSPSVELFHKFI